ncbi:MAG: ABC transporter ATP-binding protein [Bacteroidales bacterium]|nr:ABC transporter ATP-binding protein [Bacteroidales bacterium]
MISAYNIHKSYGIIKVLKGINLHIKRKEIVSIVGASGAGKTTLLQILGTLLRPDEGEVFIEDVNVFKLPEKHLAIFRNKKTGFVFQYHHLLPEFTALENICLPGYISGLPQKEVENRAKELLKFLGMYDRAHHKPSELSGGENQRIAFARALINNPDVIFADEPTGNLDSTTSQELFSLILSLREHYDTTFVIVTHNEALANISDRILLISDGKIIEEKQFV